MSEMQNTDVVGVPTMEGSEDQILAALWSLCYDAMRGVDCGDVLDAIRHIQEGNRAVQVAGEQFVVTDPQWSVEQEVFGCEKGRGCTDVTDEQRARFEVLIAARTQAGRTQAGKRAKSRQRAVENEHGSDHGEQRPGRPEVQD